MSDNVNNAFLQAAICLHFFTVFLHLIWEIYSSDLSYVAAC